MTEDGKRKNLGKGLSALLGGDDDVAEPASDSKPTSPDKISIENIYPGRYQPRRIFDEAEIAELAGSIQELGILQPILVRDHPDIDGAYEIIAGERRWRAAQLAQLHDVPILIRDLTDVEALEIALVENLQRENLSPLEEAEGYRQLIEEFSHTQDELAKIIGKSRSHLANTMRLLNLPDDIKVLLDNGDLSAGHARALLNAEDPIGLAKKVVKSGLNVRQTERLASKVDAPKPASKPASDKDANTIALENDLSTLLGLKIDIEPKGHSGKLVINYQSLEQLDDILHRLTDGAHGGQINIGTTEAPPEDPLEEMADISPDEAIHKIAEQEFASMESDVAPDVISAGIPEDVDDAIAQLEQGAAMDDGTDVGGEAIDLGGDFNLSDEDLDALVADTPLKEGAPFNDKNSEPQE